MGMRTEGEIALRSSAEPAGSYMCTRLVCSREITAAGFRSDPCIQDFREGDYSGVGYV